MHHLFGFVLVILLAVCSIPTVHAQGQKFKRTLSVDVIDASVAVADLPAHVYYQWTLKNSKGKITVSLAQRSSTNSSIIKWTTKFSETASSILPEFYVGPSGKDVYFVSLVRGSDTFIVTRRFRFSDGKALTRTRISATDCPSPYATRGAVDPSGDLYVAGICAPKSNATSSSNWLLVKRVGSTHWTKKQKGIFARNVYEPLAISYDKKRDKLYVAAYQPYKDTSIPFLAAFQGNNSKVLLKPTKLKYDSYNRLTSISANPTDGSVFVSLDDLSGSGKNIIVKVNADASKTQWRKTTKEGDVILIAGTKALYSCGTTFGTDGPARLRARDLDNGTLIHSTKIPDASSCRFIQVTGTDNVVLGTDDRQFDDHVYRYRLVSA
ncbi:hypothetical protein HDV00_006690 [Rhizophlyctis rosea]|nr:hypothetical protein HDV00_006690 [Rhizophlyctis rosea]